MCGIAGVWGAAEAARVERMVAALAHRGPDDRGVWADPAKSATLGQARLSIIDLSPGGHQPMSYQDGRLWAAFNGEIYNYRELRKELAGAGHRFHTDSDTEVLLATYAEWGVAGVARLFGMFAFAIVDLAPPSGWPRFLLARDRLGIKPVYYLRRGVELWFASETRSLVAAGVIEARIETDALGQYLAVGSVQQPSCILRGVLALPAGHVLLAKDQGFETRRYWDLHESTASLRARLRGIEEGEARELIRAKLLEATRRHMVADVPVGAFLSGGIDSTAVVGLMTTISSRPIKTFCVGFDTGRGGQDERADARAAAQHLQSQHTDVLITADAVAARFPEIVRSLDQPSADGFNTFLVSEAAHKVVKVAVSGLGGDELFAGYPHFGFAAAAGSRRLYLALALAQRALGGRGARLTPYLLRAADPETRHQLLRSTVPVGLLSAAFPPVIEEAVRTALRERTRQHAPSDADPIQQMSVLEMSTYLVSTLLRDTDVMSMAHALEVRPVLLDHELVELAYSLPGSLKWKDGRGKHIFLEAIKELIPAQLWYKPKRGFSLPYSDWMLTSLRARIEDLFTTHLASHLFRRSYLARLRSGLARGRAPFAMWAWTILLEWLQSSGYRLG